jgi:hypothetical protein
LTYTSSPCSGYFGDGVLRTTCLGWPLLASQVARNTGISHSASCIFCYILIFFLRHYVTQAGFVLLGSSNSACLSLLSSCNYRCMPPCLAIWQLLKTLNMQVIIKPAVTPLGISVQLNENFYYSHKNLYINVSQLLETIKCPLSGGWLNKLCSIHNMDYYFSNIKK